MIVCLNEKAFTLHHSPQYRVNEPQDMANKRDGSVNTSKEREILESHKQDDHERQQNCKHK